MSICPAVTLRRTASAALLLALSTAGPIVAAAPVRPPVVEYRIEASLDPKTHVVTGRERLTWRNPSGDSVGELQFHLYLNAFKNNRSTFMRESGGQLRGDRASYGAEDWGSIDLDSMTAGGVDLLPASRKIQPDGNDPSDETVLRVPLPTPVGPHGQIVLEIAFRSKLPRIFARTGFVRDYHLIGQWFPKIGVYEPAGMRRRVTSGWNCHAFHANSEFYADFGDWDVTLDVPAGFVVGATGQRVSEERRGARAVYRYKQENVHDFAWTADPRFQVVEYTFDPARDIPDGWTAKAAAELGMAEKDLALKPIAVRLLLQPDHIRARSRYVEGIRAGVSYYGLWFGAYPYPTLTVVDPPEDGLGSGGMEYPTFITGGSAKILLRWPLGGSRLIENVTLHEFGHQYFYGMSGSNEFEESWLDEGLNTDAEYRAMALAFGPRDFGQFPGGIGLTSEAIAHSALFDPNLDPIRRFAWGYATGNSYGDNSYPKVGLFMAQMRHDIGVGPAAKAERAFFQKWSFRHPNTDDFFDAFEGSTGFDLSDYRKNLVEGTARLDWQVVSAKSNKDPGDSGSFDRSGKRVTLRDGKPVKDDGKTGGKDAAADKSKKKDEKRYSTVVLFGNTGDWPHAAAARLVFEDGTTMDRTLPASARWVRLRISSRVPLAWAAVDPDRVNTWDINRLNDSKVLGTGKGAADTRGGAAVAKYMGWTAAAIALYTELVWMFS